MWPACQGRPAGDVTDLDMRRQLTKAEVLKRCGDETQRAAPCRVVVLCSRENAEVQAGFAPAGDDADVPVAAVKRLVQGIPKLKRRRGERHLHVVRQAPAGCRRVAHYGHRDTVVSGAMADARRMGSRPGQTAQDSLAA
jgi:hypothetical protein